MLARLINGAPVIHVQGIFFPSRGSFLPRKRMCGRDYRVQVMGPVITLINGPMPRACLDAAMSSCTAGSVYLRFNGELVR